MQQGAYVARLIASRLKGQTLPPFHYRDYGTMATIGRNAAVAEVGRVHISGYFAWLAWLFVHIVKLIEFENRVLVLFQWAWNYLTRNRSARLITGKSLLPLGHDGTHEDGQAAQAAYREPSGSSRDSAR
jgi:NADH dehydrogenase